MTSSDDSSTLPFFTRFSKIISNQEAHALSSLLNLDNVPFMKDAELQQFRDSRGYPILMLASEAGRVDVVQNLIDRDIFDANFEVDGESAISLAHKKGNCETVLALLKNNAKFPENFKLEGNEIDVRLKAFVDLSNEMHFRVKESDGEELKSFLQQTLALNPSLRHFYDTTNCSLLKQAILHRKFEIYEFLLSQNIFLGSHESMDEIIMNLTKDERSKLSDINLRVSHCLITESMMILMRNTKLSPDSPKERKEEFLNFIRGAFDSLFMIPSIAIVLKVVAASRNFKIVFDFKRDSVTFLDPKSEPFCEGLMYFCGKIYIGAKDMLNPETSHKVVGVIAHELTHYAMFLVYGNCAKPYRRNDSESFLKFIEICTKSERVKEVEEIVESVYLDYVPSMRHAELIVRVPHMIAMYLKNVEVLNQRRIIYKSLFDFYEQVCVPEMEKELPRVEKRFCPVRQVEEKVKKQKLLNLCLVGLVLLLAMLCGLAVFIFYKPTPVTWSELNSEDRTRIQSSLVNFHGVDLKFAELFANDSKVFDLLSSEQIKKALKGEAEELSKALNETFGPYVFLTWSNMTQKLKEKFLTLKVDFQGQKVSIANLTESDETLKLLNSKQVQKILNEDSFKVSTETKEESKIYIERFLITEEANVMSEKHCKKLEIQGPVDWFTKFYKNGSIDLNNPNVTRFDRIAETLTSSKIFLLSSAAGDGKSTTFRHFSLKLKEKFPQKWIQFVDLKKHIKVFEIGQNLDLNDFEVLSNFLGEKLLNLEGFELEIFKELFASGNVIFLWDGVDEIWSKFKEFILDLTRNIWKTKNFQLISTRPQHSKDFQNKLGVEAQKLIPFSELDRYEFLVKTIAIEFNDNPDKIFEEFKNFSNMNFVKDSTRKYFEAFSKAQTIFEHLEAFVTSEDRFVSNPLLILMISEASCDSNLKIEETSFNSFQLYETFTDRKFDSAGKARAQNIRKIHQFFALKMIRRSIRLPTAIQKGHNINFVTINTKMLLNSSEEISNFGILQVSSVEDFEFTHKTFAEFFVIQFFLDNVLSTNSKNDLNRDEVFVLFEIITNAKLSVAKSFLQDASKLDKFKCNFLTLWTENKEKNSKLTNDSRMLEANQLSNFFGMQKFDFKSDGKSNCLPNLPDLNQIEETFGPDFVRSILNYRQIGDILPPFYCSIRSEAGDEVPMQFLEKAKTFLNRTEIVSLLLDPKGFDGKNSFAEAAENRSLRFVKGFWDFALSFNLSNGEQEKLLRTNALQYSVLNKDTEVFAYIKDISRHILTEEEIKNSFLTMSKNGKLNLDRVDEKMAKQVLKFLRELFKTGDLGKLGFKFLKRTEKLL